MNTLRPELSLAIAVLLIAGAVLFLSGCESRTCLRSHKERRWIPQTVTFIHGARGTVTPVYTGGYSATVTVCDEYAPAEEKAHG